MNNFRCLRLIEQAITTFNLDLSNLVVLTEAATGYYQLTPMIAALAGAKNVYALTRDSYYGKAEVVAQQTICLAKQWNVEDRIQVLLSREDKRIGLADIVTNLGFVRPLDKIFLKRLKATAVIPLMFETWEYRTEDIDIKECRRLKIPVLGTNENHPSLKIFQYVGHLVLKLLFELDIEVYRSKIVVVGGGEFGKATVKSLNQAGADVFQININKGESLADHQNQIFLSKCDAIAVVEHQSKEKIIGIDGQITGEKIKLLNPGVVLIHIAGNVEQKSLEAAKIIFYPSKIATTGYMSLSTDYLGPKPLIDLHTAGLKIGELMTSTNVKPEKYESTTYPDINISSLAQKLEQ